MNTAREWESAEQGWKLSWLEAGGTGVAWHSQLELHWRLPLPFPCQHSRPNIHQQ